MKILKPAILACLCALLLALGNQQTRDTIAANKKHLAEKTLRDMVDGGRLEKTADGYRVYRDGALRGHIRPVTTHEGYNGRIDLLVAADLSGRVSRVRVVSHRETPGIGDAIDHRVSAWTDVFIGRSPDNSVWRLSPDGDFDAITGATVTSRATVNAVRASLSR